MALFAYKRFYAIQRPPNSDVLTSSSDGVTRFIVFHYFIQTTNTLWTIINKEIRR